MEDEGVVLNDKQKKAQRMRSIAIALLLGVLVITFYLVTVLKFGSQILNRAL